MKISIVTVAYNAEQTIGSTLDSIAAQSYPDIEHIIVDGASTDGTLDVIKHHGSRVSRVVSEPDRGIYDAMNKGIRLATGDVVGILNADDQYANVDVISRIAHIMSADSLDALYGDVSFFSSGNPELTTRRYRSQRFSPARIGWGWMPAHPSLFLRRSVFDRYGLYRTDFRIAGDFEFVARIFKDDALRYRYLPEVMVRMRGGGVSTAGWRSTLLLNREVLRACRDNGIHTNLPMLLSKYPLKIIEYFRK